MPVINEPNKVIKNTNGVLTAFTFDFKYFEDEDLIVKTITPAGVETLIALDTDYTISSDDKNAGGTVNLVVAPATGTILIKRQLPLEQGANFRPVSGFPEQVITDALDRGMMVDQDLQEQIKRSLLAQEGSSVTDLTIPNPVAGKAIVWKDDLTGLRNSTQSVDDIDTAVQAAAASAALAQAAVGVVPTAVNNTYWKRNSSGTLVNMTPEQVKEDLDPAKIVLGTAGDITSNPTFTVDTGHEGFIKADINPSLPSATANKLKHILFDFNIQPGRTFTPPSNARWDYAATPTFVAWPDILKNIATISNMVLTFPATSGQYVDLTNAPFNNLGSQTWEIILNITPTQVGVLQYFLSNSLGSYAPLIAITAANKFSLYLSSNGSSNDIVNGTSGTYTVVNNANVYVKLEFTGTQYKLSTSSDYNIATNTGTWTADITVSSSATVNTSTLTGNIRLGQAVATPTVNTFKGTIDLSKSSIKIGSGSNMLIPPADVFLNRIIWDTMSGGSKWKSHYSQVGV